MITLQSIVSELELSLGRNKLSDTPPVEWPKMIEQVKNKRASEFERMFVRNDRILSSWVSNLGVLKTEIIQDGFDPENPDMAFGRVVSKLRIPQIINMVSNPFIGDHGVNMVASADGRCIYNFAPLSHFHKMIDMESDYLHGEGVYTLVGEDIIAYPAKDFLNVKVILFDPLEGYIIDTRFRKSGELVFGNSYNPALEYQVHSGQIEHDGIIYFAGESFVATSATFTGNGLVRLKESKRKLEWTDPYPIDSKTKDVILKRIIGEDYALELQLPVDNKADGQNQSHIDENVKSVRASQQ